MFKDITQRQAKFLLDYHDGLKSLKVLREDYKVSVEEFAAWKTDKLFRAALRTVLWSLSLHREMDIRLAGAEAGRFVYCAVRDKVGFKNAWHFRMVREAIEQAREVDQTLQRWRRPMKREDLIDPVHPAYRADAERMMDEMELIHIRAQKRRKGDA